MKKILLLSLTVFMIFMSSCSRESKFGIEQFVTRMEKDYEVVLNTSDFLLGETNGEEFLFYESGNRITTLSLDSNNKIKGISLLLIPDENIESAVVSFCQICSVFTGNTYEVQSQIFKDGKITAEYINYADSNMVITVGRYKYTVVCNDYSVTLFCDKV